MQARSPLPYPPVQTSADRRHFRRAFPGRRRPRGRLPTLPFGDATESVASSRQASPSATRAVEVETPTALPILPPAVPPVESAASRSGFEAAISAADSTNNIQPAASEGPNEAVIPSAAARDSAKSPDPFEAMDQAKAKEDFDSAFASFRSARANQTVATTAEPPANAFTAFATEFPPISEYEHDDSSDSGSDNGGFDDDFAPVSPPPKGVEGSAETAAARLAPISHDQPDPTSREPDAR